MGKPIMLGVADDEKITRLKQEMGSRTKVEVVRRALDLLDRELAYTRRVQRWKAAAGLARESSAEVLADFQPASRLKREE